MFSLAPACHSPQTLSQNNLETICIFASNHTETYMMALSTKIRAKRATVMLADKISLCCVVTADCERQQVPVPNN